MRLIIIALLLIFTAPAWSDETLPGPYEAQVLRLVDGDTMQVRVKLWLGLYQETLVRLYDVDTPEIHSHCASEKAMAERAKATTQSLLATSGNRVSLRNIHRDKYGGRVLAKVEAGGKDISQKLIDLGLGRRYHGEKKSLWCQ